MPHKREYFSKGEDITNWTDEEINSGIKELNLRARKCLNYRTPYEEYYGVRLLLGLANTPFLTKKIFIIK